MNKKKLKKLVTKVYTEYLHRALMKGNLYLAGELTMKEFEKELEVLADEYNKKFPNR